MSTNLSTNLSTNFFHINAVVVPAESQVTHYYPTTNLADAFEIQLPDGATTDPERLAHFIFSNQPDWVHNLMRVRDFIVSAFGLKTAKQLNDTSANPKVRRVGIFRIYSTSAHEIVLGEDDRHLDFRLSLMCAAPQSLPGPRRLTLSTVVHCHNRLGRLYILVIAPFHRAVVKSSLRRAARIGWPKA